MLIVVFGLPGTGKTTFGKLLAHRLKGIHLNSDVIRTFMGLRGNYDPASKARVYEALLRETENQLMHERTVVLDASFYRTALRGEVTELAAHLAKPLYWIELQASEDSIKKRVSRPRPDSEADFSVYQRLQAQFEPMTEDHLILWSDRQPMEEMLEAACRYIGKSQNYRE